MLINGGYDFFDLQFNNISMSSSSSLSSILSSELVSGCPRSAELFWIFDSVVCALFAKSASCF